ncbi:hypothetical protein [Gangjinia marincola]
MRLINFFILLFIIVSCKAQIVPVEDLVDYMDSDQSAADGTYFKDINDKLSKFYGHWQAVTSDGKQLDFYIEPKLIERSETGKKYDKLNIRYTIKENGVLLVDTTNLPDNAVEVISGGFFGTNKATYQIPYQGFSSACGQNGNLLLRIKGLEDAQMNYIYRVGGEIWSKDCPPGGVDQIMPMEHLTFTKDPVDVIED